MKYYVLIILMSLTYCSLLAQKKPIFEAKLSYDTIGTNSVVTLKYTLKNIEGNRIKLPDLSNFDVNGPTTSSSMVMMNGNVERSSSSVYYLKPKKKGKIKIEPASVDVDGKTLYTSELILVVKDGYEGIEKEDMDDAPITIFGPNQTKPKEKEKKKSYKTYKL
jgi:BatD DUF11 like domain